MNNQLPDSKKTRGRATSSKRLTSKKISALRPEDVIYAEIANAGAMGNAGGVIFYIFENNNLVLYETNIFNHQKDYESAYNFLKAHEDKYCFLNGGFGNYVYALGDSCLEDSSKDFSFYYPKNGKKYKITPSVRGVYEHVKSGIVELTNFSREKQVLRLFDLYSASKEAEENQKDFEKQLQPSPAQKSKAQNSESNIKISADLFKPLLLGYDQLLFTRAIFKYFDDLRSCSTREELRFSPKEWHDALCFIMIKNQEAFNYGDLIEISGRTALFKYRLRYAIDKIGFYQFFNIIDDFFIGDDLAESLKPENIAKRKGELFERINKVLGEKLEEKFAKVEVTRHSDTDFRYPEIVNFTDQEDDEIIQAILDNNYSQTDFYYKNYLFYTNKKSLAKILPAAFHTVSSVAEWESDLFYTAGDVINSAWENVVRPEDDDRIKKMIYNAYWPRVGDAWPVEHYEEINFKSENKTTIFEDSVGWLSSIDEASLKKLNPRLVKAIEVYQANIRAGQDAERFLINITSKLTSRKQAKHVLDDAFSGKLEIDDLNWLMERILLNPKPKGVGPYVISRIATEFSDKSEMLIWHFTAACEGATEKAELPELEKFAQIVEQKTKKTPALDHAADHSPDEGANADHPSDSLPPENPLERPDLIIKNALKAAAKHVKTAEFQQRCMIDFFSKEWPEDKEVA